LSKPDPDDIVYPKVNRVELKQSVMPEYLRSDRAFTGAPKTDILSNFMYKIPPIGTTSQSQLMTNNNPSPIKSESLLYSPFTHANDSRLSKISSVQKLPLKNL